jgi:hypothetical protein
MAKQVDIRKTVYNKEQFTKIVDNTFNTYKQPIPEQDPDTIQELFRLYDKLYFEIDLEGQTQSHRYLVNRSLELINFEANTEEIQPLLDEIAQLREQLLIANQQIIDLEIKQK